MMNGAVTEREPQLSGQTVVLIGMCPSAGAAARLNDQLRALL
jgi:hypothetical protein